MLAAALIATGLAGCGLSADRPVPQPKTGLPKVPADLRACFEAEGVDIPDRDLNAGEVERLWKEDRRKGVAWQRCGRRLLAWIDERDARWR